MSARQAAFPEGLDTTWDISPVFLTRVLRLSPRQKQVWRLVALCQSELQISDALSISCDTVRRHKKGLRITLDIHNSIKLTVAAIACGIVGPQDYDFVSRATRTSYVPT